ncbi:FMN-binding negative transcriptional regulator [Kribbella kalugense]|uniref:PaiB family negative transcriptional regulator n=1 Tax=Kribbella kalugense TaxID=2512221 RepID=A0A4R8A561_9ACTN|nr:FMN-binding negative transcriptional regulator [Kribbella kalugense]TDW24628.1 PaiB family negative transcriptional regulator [Kribbella kalugense]
MYVDPDYAEPDLDEVVRLIEAQPFATVVTADPDLRIAHIPVQVRRGAEALELVAHVAGADPFAESIRQQAHVLVSVVGPSVYVSPAWYASRGLPTYNFVAIELRGQAVPLDDPDAVRAHLMRLVQDHETALNPADSATRWRVDAWARDRTTELLPELQAFTLRVDQIHAKVKLGQNRTEGDRAGTMTALHESPRTDHHVVESLMRARYDEDGRVRGEA